MTDDRKLELLADDLPLDHRVPCPLCERVTQVKPLSVTLMTPASLPPFYLAAFIGACQHCRVPVADHWVHACGSEAATASGDAVGDPPPSGRPPEVH